MKRKLFLLLCALLTMVGVTQVKAYTVDELTNDGWTQVTAASITGVSDNYYILVDANSSAYVMSAEADHYRPCYKTIADPKEHPSFVWNLEGSNNKFQLKSFATGAYFKQSSGWNTSVGDGRNGSTASLQFTLSEGKYSIQCVGQGLVGHWNDGGAAVASDGENIAANKAAANAPGFYLYSISKETYNAAIKAARAAEVSSATKESPADVTSYIQNADWSGDWGAWEFTCTSSGNIQWGQKTLESWNANNVIVKQVLSGVPDGLYRLSADLISGNNDNKTAYVFAVGAGEVKSDPVSAVASAGNYGTMSEEVAGNTLTAENIVVTNGVLTVGVNQPSGWIVADNFKLYYMGEDLSIYIEAYHDALDAAGAVNQSDPMNAEVLTALQTALSTYASVDETSKAALQEATGALGIAASNANNSIAAYAKAASAIATAEAIQVNNNFVTAAAATTFADAIAAIKTPYTSRTLANEEAENAGTSLGVVAVGWHAAATNTPASNYMISTWPASLTVNDWSVEGVSDGSNYLVPFFQDWIGDAESLAAKSWTGSLDGLENGTYEVSAWVRVRAKNGVATGDATGITMKVDGGEAVDVTEGVTIGTTQFQMDTYAATGYVTNGTLKLNFDIASGNNISWLSIKNVKYTRTGDLPAADAADYAALKDALDAVAGNVVGFEAGEYAPYNNKEAVAALNVAKAIDPTVINVKATVQAATAALTGATWTANAEELNAVYDGNFAIQPEHTTGPTALAGWNNPAGIRQLIKNTETYPGLNTASAKAAVFAWGSTTMKYGETDGYTIPLKGHAIYELSFKTCGWIDGDMGYVNVDVKNASDEGLQTVRTATATKRINGENPWNEFKILFVTGEAGNYKLGMWTSKHTTFTDIVLKKAASQTLTFDDDAAMPAFAPGTYPSVKITRTLTANKWATAVYPFAVSGVDNIAVLDSYNSETGIIGFTTAAASTANEPFLMRSTEGTSEISLSNVAVVATVAEPVVTKNEASLKGVYASGKVPVSEEGNVRYVVSGNQLYKVDSDVNIKPFRAYFEFVGDNEARPVLRFDDTTAINAIEAAEAEAGALKDGKYLIDGKIVLVKNGVKYSANGQKLN